MSLGDRGRPPAAGRRPGHHGDAHSPGLGVRPPPRHRIILQSQPSGFGSRPAEWRTDLRAWSDGEFSQRRREENSCFRRTGGRGVPRRWRGPCCRRLDEQPGRPGCRTGQLLETNCGTCRFLDGLHRGAGQRRAAASGRPGGQSTALGDFHLFLSNERSFQTPARRWPTARASSFTCGYIHVEISSTDEEAVLIGPKWLAAPAGAERQLGWPGQGPRQPVREFPLPGGAGRVPGRRSCSVPLRPIARRYSRWWGPARCRTRAWSTSTRARVRCAIPPSRSASWRDGCLRADDAVFIVALEWALVETEARSWRDVGGPFCAAN